MSYSGPDAVPASNDGTTSIGHQTSPFTRQLVGVAGYVEALKRGPRAMLRRLGANPDHIPPQVFWDIVDRYGIARHEEDFWLAVVPLMVQHPHQFGNPPGRALAGAGVSAARVERWLRLDRAAAFDAASRLLSHLGDGGLDWTRLGPLLRYWNDDQRRGFARDFFLSPGYRQRTATAGES